MATWSFLLMAFDEWAVGSVNWISLQVRTNSFAYEVQAEAWW